MKRIISIILIVSMIFTMGGFATLADSISDVVGADTIRPIDGVSDDTVGADTICPINGANNENVGADIIRPTVNADNVRVSSSSDIDDEFEETIIDYSEEPEEDIINLVVGAESDTVGADTIRPNDGANDNTDGANDDTVGADIIRPTDGDNQQNNDNNKYNISTNSNAEEILNSDENVTSIENTKLDINNINLATISEVLENINVASESQIDAKVVSNENIATTSTINLATFSELSSNNLLLENIASYSEINIASYSEINIASYSEIKIVSLSEINNIASSSQLFGDGNNLPWKFYFGTYPQHDSSGVQYEPIEWRIISQNGSEALVYTYNVLGGSRYGRAGTKWETSGTRAYLKNVFINKAFTENQINHCIIEKSLQTDDEVTIDKVFLMMPEDGVTLGVNKYAYATEFAKTEGATPWLTHTVDWWFRKPIYYFDGVLSKVFPTAKNPVGGIRPTMYLNTALPIFESGHKISFNLDFASWKSQSSLWKEFTSYYGGQKLPVANNLSIPDGVEFVGWSKDGTVDNLMTEIPLDCTEELSLKAIFKSNIVWDLSDGTTGKSGTWDGNAGASFYYTSKTYTLPTNVNAPAGTKKFFDHWEIDGKAVDAIPAGTRGVKTIKAIYGELPGYIYFGTYPQNDASGNELEPIRWKVVKQDGKEALLLAEKVIDYRGFKNNLVVTTWEDSDVRVWLNDTFINKAFTINQINNNIIDKNLTTRTLSGDVETEDKVFLLSFDEYYGNIGSFSGPEERLGTVTTYTRNLTWNGEHIPTGYRSSGPWWLRSQQQSGVESNQADLVNHSVPGVDGANVNIGGGIRPSIYINLRNQKLRSNLNALTWQLGPARFKDTSTLWNEYTIYQPGQKLPTEENLVIPDGLQFVGFRNINDKEIITMIPEDAIGDITLKLKFNATVTWNLTDGNTGNVGIWNGEAGPAYFDTEVGIPTLPTNITPPPHKIFDHWEVNGKKVTSIEPADIGGIEIRAVYRGETYKITWDLKDGSSWETGVWEDGVGGPTSYEYGIGVKQFPTNVIGTLGKEFDHWEIGGIATTSITTKDLGNKTIKAVYKVIEHEYIWLGVYPQNDISGKQLEPIKWRIINKTSDEMLLVSENILEKKEHHNRSSEEDTWRNSLIRTWLSDDFSKKAFSSTQLGNIIIKNTDSERSEIKDKIYLLSDKEAEYMPKNDRHATSTKYAVRNGQFDNAWWLRSKVLSSVYYIYVNSSSDLLFLKPSTTQYGVRPAISIDIKDSTIYRKDNNSLTFNLNGKTWKTESTLWGEIDKYQGGQQLPTLENINVPAGQEFIGWSIDDTDTVRFTNEIPENYTGDLELKAVYQNKHYNLTFDMGGGHLISTPSNYEYSVGLTLPSGNNIVPPVGKEFVHWEIDGNEVNSITASDSGDKVVKAIYKNKKYKITFNMGEGHLVSTPSEYEYSVGLTLPKDRDVVPPRGRSLDHFEINGKTVTKIETDDYGDKIVLAVYKNNKYSITWEYTYIGDRWSFVDGFNPPTEYEYSVGINSLPGASSINNQKYRLGEWFIYNNDTSDLTWGTKIDKNSIGDLTLSPSFRPKSFNITYKNEDGSNVTWNGTAGPFSYTYGSGIEFLPTNVIPPTNKVFDHWEMDGNEITGINTDEYENKTLIAKYKNKKYKITWQLDQTFSLYDPSIDDDIDITIYGDWKDEPGKDSYTYGVGYVFPASSSVICTPGFMFDGWSIEDSIESMSNEISKEDFGDKVVQASYRTEEYNVTWNYNGAVLTLDADISPMHPSVYAYGDVHAMSWELIDASDINNYAYIPDGKIPSHWTVNGVRSDSIPQGSRGDLTISLIFTDIPHHNITWDYGTHENHWSFTNGYVAPATYSEGTAVIFPDKSFVLTPDGRELDYFTLDGVRATEIPSSSINDVTVSAVLKNKTYRIKYNLGDGNWDGVEGATTYTHGTPYILPTNIVGKRGQEFDHWEIGDVTTTSIEASDFGHKEFTAVYRNKTYNITWELRGAIIDASLTPSTYEYGQVVHLPEATDISNPDGFIFDHWEINGRIVTDIVAGNAEDITVTLVYESYDIIWQFGLGHLVNYTPKAKYEKGIGLLLPTADKVVPKKNYKFSHWTVNGIQATEISSTLTGVVVVTAVYKGDPYNITWELKGAIINESLTPSTYEYGKVIHLPESSDITNPYNLVFNHWEIDGKKVTDIEAGTLGDITVTIVYESYDIIWELGSGRFMNYIPPAKYESGVGLLLPSGNRIKIQGNYKFDYWTVNGEEATEISNRLSGTVTVKAVYKVSSNPYNPSGGSTSGGGGGSSSVGPIAINQNIVPITKIDQIKTIKSNVDVTQISWVYDPILNKFKMNVGVSEQKVFAVDGFYLINSVKEQEVNGVKTYINETATYYFDKNGNMLTGWINTIDNKWYYLETVKTEREGMMVFGWYQVQDKWYYFMPDGTMLVNSLTPDGYFVGADGAWIQMWQNGNII